jgi:hypothetical protein
MLSRLPKPYRIAYAPYNKMVLALDIVATAMPRNCPNYLSKGSIDTSSYYIGSTESITSSPKSNKIVLTLIKKF